jgi:hypothetical protein
MTTIIDLVPICRKGNFQRIRKPCICTRTVYQKIVSLNKIDATEADTTIPQSFNVINLLSKNPARCSYSHFFLPEPEDVTKGLKVQLSV